MSARLSLVTPQLHMRHASPGMMHDSAALSIESAVNHRVLIVMLSAGCKLLIVVWYKRATSMLVRANICRPMHSARRSWTRCCCTDPAWSGHCVSHQPMAASQMRYITIIMHCQLFQVKTVLLLLHLSSCSCRCALVVALDGHVMIYGQEAFHIGTF